MNMELTPGEMKMAEHAASDAQAVANLLTPPVSAQHVHDAERRAKHVLASIQYLKTRVYTESLGSQRPGRD